LDYLKTRTLAGDASSRCVASRRQHRGAARAREGFPAGGTPVLSQEIKGSRLTSNARAHALATGKQRFPTDF